MFEVKAGNVVVQSYEGFSHVDTYLIVEILSETDTEYTLLAFYTEIPTGVFYETLKKDYLKNDGIYLTLSKRRFITRVL